MNNTILLYKDIPDKMIFPYSSGKPWRKILQELKRRKQGEKNKQ